MDAVRALLEVLCRALSRVGPYLAVEVLLPGGTLIALLLYCYRRRPMQGSVEIQPGRSTMG
jgi:hypothetical protein